MTSHGLGSQRGLFCARPCRRCRNRPRLFDRNRPPSATRCRPEKALSGRRSHGRAILVVCRVSTPRLPLASRARPRSRRRTRLDSRDQARRVSHPRPARSEARPAIHAARQHACALGCEGIVSKRLGSHYRSGRVDHWLKIKNPSAPAVKREAEEDWGRKRNGR
jgi:hypothetical protein